MAVSLMQGVLADIFVGVVLICKHGANMQQLMKSRPQEPI